MENPVEKDSRIIKVDFTALHSSLYEILDKLYPALPNQQQVQETHDPNSILPQMHKKLVEGGLVVLKGASGSGKSHYAKKYQKRYINLYSHILFISAKTSTSTISSLEAIAKEYEIPIHSTLIKSVFNFFTVDSRILVVLDDANPFNIPEISCNFNINCDLIITCGEKTPNSLFQGFGIVHARDLTELDYINLSDLRMEQVVNFVEYVDPGQSGSEWPRLAIQNPGLIMKTIKFISITKQTIQSLVQTQDNITSTKRIQKGTAGMLTECITALLSSSPIGIPCLILASSLAYIEATHIPHALLLCLISSQKARSNISIKQAQTIASMSVDPFSKKTPASVIYGRQSTPPSNLINPAKVINLLCEYNILEQQGETYSFDDTFQHRARVNIEEMVACFNSVLAKDPDPAIPHLLKLARHAQLPVPLLEKALEKCKIAKFQEMILLLINKQSSTLLTRERLGDVCFQLGKFSEALEYFESNAEELRLQDVQKYCNNLKRIAATLVKLNDHTTALEKYMEVISINRNDVEVCVDVGKLLSKLDNAKESRDYFEKALLLENDDVKKSRILLEYANTFNLLERLSLQKQSLSLCRKAL